MMTLTEKLKTNNITDIKSDSKIMRYTKPRVLCPYCEQKITSNGIHNHIKFKHPDKYMEWMENKLDTIDNIINIEENDGTVERYAKPRTNCPFCEKVLSVNGLTQHIKFKHPDEYIEWKTKTSNIIDNINNDDIEREIPYNVLEAIKFKESDVRDMIDGNDLNLRIIEKEYVTEIGRIDILCEDQVGNKIPIEIKLSTANDSAIGQLLGYMKAIGAENGIIIAQDFHPRVEYIAKDFNIKLIQYELGVKLKEFD